MVSSPICSIGVFDLLVTYSPFRTVPLVYTMHFEYLLRLQLIWSDVGWLSHHGLCHRTSNLAEPILLQVCAIVLLPPSFPVSWHPPLARLKTDCEYAAGLVTGQLLARWPRYGDAGVSCGYNCWLTFPFKYDDISVILPIWYVRQLQTLHRI